MPEAAQLESPQDANRRFGVGLARAFGGAVIFSLPILLTQEMWHQGFAMDPWRLVLLLGLAGPLLVGLSYLSGFEETFRAVEDIVDAFVAYAVGFAASGLVLLGLGVLEVGRPLRELVGIVAVQAVPAAIGALLAQSILGNGQGRSEEEKRRRAGYWGELFLMAAGALFLAFPVAPTEEIVLVAHRMTALQAVALALASLGVMHAFVYSLGFRGSASEPRSAGFVSVFARYSVAGYAVALAVGTYLLWTFGSLDGRGLLESVKSAVVVGFPAALGAAAARLLL